MAARQANKKTQDVAELRGRTVTARRQSEEARKRAKEAKQEAKSARRVSREARKIARKAERVLKTLERKLKKLVRPSGQKKQTRKTKPAIRKAKSAERTSTKSPTPDTGENGFVGSTAGRTRATAANKELRRKKKASQHNKVRRESMFPDAELESSEVPVATIDEESTGDKS
jgi:hypothetical protein